jgi:hypothetical protein
VRLQNKRLDSSKTKGKRPMSNHMSQHLAQQGKTAKNLIQSKKKKRKKTCHHCGKEGHIRTFCFELYGFPRFHEQFWNRHLAHKNQSKITCLIAHTSLRVSSKDDWYFDSGCSKHMTGEKAYLKEVKNYSNSYVTFGDGPKGKIKGIGNLSGPELPNLDNVLLVEGLTANLISISQLCDQGLKVSFNNSECIVSNKGQEIMKGSRSKDNCYLWQSQHKKQGISCMITKEDETKLWHQKLGHLNLKSMRKLIIENAVRGLPKFKIEEGKICGECQIGKQTKMSHKKVRHMVTTRNLELLHMDLMGPMQVESLGGKRYVLVCVDDYSRYTWVRFIREKSNAFDVFKELCHLIEKEQGSEVIKIRSDHGKEFENSKFSEFCATKGIEQEFSAPITPQQNGVLERKNRTLQECTRAMLHAQKLP